jgi:hypothetical protein
MARNLIFAVLKAEGEVSEWLKEHAWKVCIVETLSRVRIPPSPLKSIHLVVNETGKARKNNVCGLSCF